ncbi:MULTISPECIES: L-histidine N(alpha)-methyltransferase [Pseudomonas]|uniref:L-histidine N(alpha)-methyltransferase n=1 Tax=Pseudomonas sp. MAG002Y TaxID=2678690 RepID=UPI001C60B472|nr:MULTISPECIES: L-histidine N(alpha)-methyltransferase [Pseudomonas]MBW5413270.1 L-histidine N(alpha)-methyltransferase [Pseudomonas sp. MAG002Y]
MALAVRFYDQQPDVASDSLREDVLNGLATEPKAIPPKYFYDQRGSELFEAITGTPEYYPTRTEERILTEAAGDIAAIAGSGMTLMELGSGASRKIRLLLEALRPQSYLGVDISRDFLLSSTHRLAADYPWLDVSALCTDFTQPMELPQTLGKAPVLAFFPGSSIGNFTPTEARSFLRNLHRLLPPGSGLLIGVDLVKSKARLEAAYNDAEGITAAFNLNLLERIRREMDTDLDPSRFSHYAFYNEQQSRIEMHLVSRRAQTIRVEDQRFMFRQGETLHTENSYKYSLKGFETLSREAGFSPIAVWKDPAALFSVHYLGR